MENEEKRNVKWFLLLFYIISISYDIFYYCIYAKYIANVGLPDIFNYWIYVVMIGLLPLAYYLNKKGYQNWVKYVYFITYIVLMIINDIYVYWGQSKEYGSGNVVELFLVLFSPIFVNSRFFWVVSLGTLCKYILVGSIIGSSSAMMPIILVIVLSGISYILLNRFQGYVAAVKMSYNNSLEGIVKGIIATLELKDRYTRGHSERVAAYAVLLAKETKKFTKDELKAFNYACLLHDIGKIHIPDHILMKPSKLTDEEFEIVKTHTVVGADAVKDVEGLQGSIEVIRSHHERWDGRGYPDQLKGNEIPLLARITSIADAFDAMTSTRSYRAALSVEEAYKRIVEGAGTQFDPQLVKIFQKVYPSWVEFHNKFPWNSKSDAVL
ncbi:MAG: HD-GYP domain-containing protein [Ectobacillus sp.]